MSANQPAPAPPGPAISQRALAMPSSPIRRSFMAARQLEAEGHDVVRLDIGDPDFDLPEHYAQAVKDALDAKHTHYSPVQGLPHVREEVSRHMQRRFGLDYPADQVVLSQGATQGLNAAQLFCCSAGDTIVLPEIYWANYIQQVAIAGIRPAFYKLDDGFQPVLSDLDAIAADAAAANSRIGAILINSPGNPTGALFTRPQLEAMLAFAAAQNAWIISDEAYCDYVFTGEHVSPLHLDAQSAPETRRVLGVFSGSKSYAATGLRMGWTVVPTLAAAARLGLLNEPLTGSLTTPVQYGLASALQVEDAGARRDQLRARWQLTGEVLTEAGLRFDPPEGGLFYFVDISATGMQAEEFAAELLQQQHVAVVAGGGFGMQPAGDGAFAPSERAARYVRLCFAVPEHRLRAGLSRLADFIKSRLA